MTLKRVSFLQEFLRFLGLGERLHLEWLSSAEAQKFVQVVTAFTVKIRMLGASPLALFNQRFMAMIPGPGPGFAVNLEPVRETPTVG
jgi:F420-non-reducing hydrogenase iron-sulfur subunit